MLKIDEQGGVSQRGPLGEKQAMEQYGRNWVPGEAEKIVFRDRKDMQAESLSDCM